jgi:hypothetical protein
MSKMGNYVVGLQEHSTYQDGWEAADRGEIRHCFILRGVDREAWMLGYDARKLEDTNNG